MGDRALPSFKCPVTMAVMEDPVSTVDGQTYERSAIQRWFESRHVTSPLTGLRLEKHGALDLSLVPNLALRSAVEQWVAAERVCERGFEAAERASRRAWEAKLEEEERVGIEMAGQILQARGEASDAAEAAAEAERWREKGRARQMEALERREAEMRTALQEARSKGLFERDIDELRERSVHIKDEAATRMYTPLMFAAHLGGIEDVKLLTSAGADVMKQDPSGRSCLVVAAYDGHLDVVEHLVEKGGMELLTLTQDNRVSCLSIATQEGHLDVVKHLAEKGGRKLLMLMSEDGDSCLHIAAQEGYLDATRYLMEKGGRELLMLTLEEGVSCLLRASQQGYLDVVKHLAEIGGRELLMLTDA